MHAQRFADTGPEAVRLDQHRHQGIHLLHPGTHRQVAQRAILAAAGAQLQVHQMQFVGKNGALDADFFADFQQSRIQPQAGLDTNQQQVDGIGKVVEDFLLPLLDAPRQGTPAPTGSWRRSTAVSPRCRGSRHS
ncbi:hypothetical protein D3C78_1468490 [compost metagenome]